MRYEIFENKLYLIEGIEELKKYFPKIPSEKIDELVKLDPTYNPEKNVAGMFSRWIIQMYWNSIVNEDKKIKYDDFIKMYPSGIHPKTGQEIKEPIMRPEIKDEDLYKVPGLLSNYIKYKSKLKKINDYNSLGELSADISPLLRTGITASKAAEQSLTVIKEAIVDGFNVIFNNSHWLIGIPETYSSSAHFKKPITDWCTAYPEMYRHYMDDYGGKYYILLNKKTGELFQFHFESQQFMDKNDRRIDLNNFLKVYPDVNKFFQVYSSEESPGIYFYSELNPDLKYTEKSLFGLAKAIYSNNKLKIHFSKRIYEDKLFWNKLFKIYIKNFSGRIDKFRVFMDNYISSSINQSEYIKSGFSYINNILNQNERNAIVSTYPEAFSYIKSYRNEHIENLTTFYTRYDPYAKISQCLSIENIKKFTSDNIKTLKGMIVNRGETNASDYSILTNGVIEAFDEEYLVDTMVNWSQPIQIFNGIFQRFATTSYYSLDEGSKTFKKLLKVFNGALERAYDMRLFKGKNEYLNVDDNAIKRIVDKLSDKAYKQFLSLFNIKSENHNFYTLSLLLGNADENIQKLLFKRDVRTLYFVNNVDPYIQKEMVDKNKFNVRYIRHLDKKVKEYALKKYPELKDFIRGI